MSSMSARAGKARSTRCNSTANPRDAHYVVASGLTMPVGVAFRDGNLYVSAVDRILRFDGIGSASTIPRRR
jgi:glucose/arabinose dehydrogenase